VISGQIAVLGLHDSAQKHASEFSDRKAEGQVLCSAAVALALLTGLISASVLAFASEGIGSLCKSPEVGRGVFFLAPGLFLFTLNKVLMGILNGQRRMVAFAIGQSVRAVAILVVCLAIVLQGWSPRAFGMSFTLGEIVVLIFLSVIARPFHFSLSPLEELLRWMSRHFKFGSKALLHGFLSETFIRVDIIILGIFLSDREVGIYSFAALFLEGIYQVAIVIRNINNPILVRLLLMETKQSLVTFSRRTAAISFSATLGLSTVIAVVYPHLGLFLPTEVINTSYGLVCILMAGLLVYSPFVPFDYIFLQAGQPGTQSLLMAVNSTINATLNVSLIPLWGLYGASIATALAFVLSGLTLNLLIVHSLGFSGGLFLEGQPAVKSATAFRPR